jgi:protein-disulfide isomerase
MVTRGALTTRALGGALFVVVACLVLLTLLAAPARPATARHSHRNASRPTLLADASAVEAELAGIPQKGLSLGSSAAPVTVVEYADLICTPCANASANLLAPLIGEYVRQGTVRLELDPITMSERSSEYAYGAYSASLQGEGWDYALLAYARSSASSNGPADAPKALARALGLNLRAWRLNLFRPRWAKAVENAVAIASVGGFTSFPVFTVRGLPAANGHIPVTVLRPPVTLPALSAAITKVEGP